MIKNYLKTALRQLSRQRYYTFLTISGLGLAITCSLFIYIYNRYQLSFDQFHTDKDRTFMVVRDLKLEQVEHSKGGSYAMYEAIAKEIPQVEKAALYMDKKEMTLRIDGQLYKTKEKAAFASSDYFDILNFPWLQGNPKDLDKPNTVALTASMARVYFNEVNPMGKTILVESRFPVQVVGIIDDSHKNSDFRSEIYFSLQSVANIWQLKGKDDAFFYNWGVINSSNNILLTLKDEKDKMAVEKTIHELIAKHWDKEVLQYYSYKLLPLNDFHFNRDYGKGTQHTLLMVLSLIAVGIGIMALVNYSNIIFAQQMNRSLEMGVRKILGSSKRQLFVQFIVESSVLTTGAVLFALLLLTLFLQWANQSLFESEPIYITHWELFFSFIAMTWLMTTVLTAIYPLIFVNRTNIQQSLKKLSIGPWSFTRKSFIVLQNVVAMLLLISTFVIVLQVQYLKNTDVGFDRDQIVIVPMTKEALKSKEKIAHFLANRADVKAFALCDNPPSNERVWGGTFQFDSRAEWEKWPARYAIGDSAYIQTFNIKLLAGRNFKYDTIRPEFLINEHMSKALGFQDPNDIIGKGLNPGGLNDGEAGKIVGVVSDFSTNSLNEGISPTVIGYNEGRLKNIAIKCAGADDQQLLKELEKQWKRWYPDEVFAYRYYDEQIADLYKKEALLEKLIWIAASVAISISVLGLLGLLSINILRRTKEIGVRKVLGSSVSGIVLLLSQEFFKWIVIAFAVAAPFAYYLTNIWLENFPFRIETSWWIFALAFACGLFITILAISFQSIKAARANPVDSLRDE